MEQTIQETNPAVKTQAAKETAEDLKRVLANSYGLMLKTQNYHWNVRGSLFRAIHLMTEEQYEDMFASIDEIAERIRALGHVSPGSFEAFQELYELTGNDPELSDEEMINDLVAGHGALSKMLKQSIKNAEEKEDFATADLLTERLHAHDKYAWMLRSVIA